MKKIFSTLLVFAVFLSACASTFDEPVSSDTPHTNEPQANYLPQPADSLLTRGEAYIDSSDLLTMESYPLQFMLNIKGNLPTPCHQLRALVNPPDAENKILVEVYSVSDPNAICVQALSPFEVNIPLGSFAAGKYVLFVNGNQVAEFDA